jgi:hypothetical protein
MELNDILRLYMERYSDFMNDVLDLHEAFDIPVNECIELVVKRYPDLYEN